MDDGIKDGLATAVAFKAISSEGDTMANTKTELKIVLPSVMRAIGRAGSTVVWVVVWAILVSYFSIGGTLAFLVTILIIARGVAKYSSKEESLRMKDEKNRRNLAKMSMKIEKEKAKHTTTNIIKADVPQQTGDQPGLMPPGEMGGA